MPAEAVPAAAVLRRWCPRLVLRRPKRWRHRLHRRLRHVLGMLGLEVLGSFQRKPEGRDPYLKLNYHPAGEHGVPHPTGTVTVIKLSRTEPPCAAGDAEGGSEGLLTLGHESTVLFASSRKPSLSNMIKVRILKWGRACVSWSRGRSGRRVTSKLSILDLDVAGSFDSPSVSPTGGELFLLFLRWKKQGGLHHQCSCLVPRRKLTLRASSSSRRWRSTAALHFESSSSTRVRV